MTIVDTPERRQLREATRVAAGEPVVTEVAMAKNVAVAAYDHVVDAALQLHGGFGYLRDAEVERHYGESS